MIQSFIEYEKAFLRECIVIDPDISEDVVKTINIKSLPTD